MPSVSLDLELNTRPLQDDIKKAEGYIDDTRKRIRSEKGIELAIDLAKLKLAMDEVNLKIKAAIAAGDPDRLIKLKIDQVALQKDIQVANRAYNNFINTGNQNFSALARLFNSVGLGWGKLEGTINGIGSALAKVGISSASVSSTLWGIGTGLLGLGGIGLGVAGLVSGLADATKAAYDFQKQMAQVKAVSNGTQKEYDDLTASIIALSNATGQNSTELAKTTVGIVQAGVALKDVSGVLDTVTKAALINGSSGETVFGGLSAVASTYGIELSKLTSISDLFFQANVQGKVDVEGLSGAIGTVAPIAATAGVSLGELIATFSTLTGNTGDVNEVATQAKGAIQAIAAPAKESADAARALGIDLGTSAIKAKGFVGVIQDIYDKTGGNIEQIRKIIPEVRSLNLVLALGSQYGGKFSENLQELETSTNATSNAFNKYTDENVSDLDRSAARWDNWKKSVGGVFVSFGAFLVNGLGYIQDFFKGLSLGLAFSLQAISLVLTAIVEGIYEGFKFLIVNFVTLGKNLVTIAGNIGYDIGQAFNAIPGLIALALQKGLDSVTSFLNDTVASYNSFVKGLGADALTLDFKVNPITIAGAKEFAGTLKGITDGTEELKGLDFGVTQYAFNSLADNAEKYGNVIKEMTGSIEKNNVALTDNEAAKKKNETQDVKAVNNLDTLRKSLAAYKSQLETTAIGTPAFKQLQADIKATQDAINKAEGKAPAGSKKSKKTPEQLAKDAADAKEKELRAAADVEIAFINQSKRTEVEKAAAIKQTNENLQRDIKNIQGKGLQNTVDDADAVLKANEKWTSDLKKKANDAYDDIDKAEKEHIDNIQKATEKIKDLQDKFADLRKTAGDDIRSLTEDLKGVADDKTKASADTMTKIAERRVDLLKEQKDLQSGLLTETDPQKVIDDNKRLLEIAKELAVIQQNVPQAVLDEIAKKKALTDTEQDLLDLKEKQAELDKQAASLEQQRAVKRAVAAGRAITVTGEGEDIKAFYTDEKGNVVEITDFKAKEYAIDTAQKTTELQNQLDIQTDYLNKELTALQAQDALKRDIESKYTAFFGGEIENRKAKLAEYLQAAQEAQAALASIGLDYQAAQLGATEATNGTTNNSTKTITVNNNVTNAMDLDKITRQALNQ